MAGSATGGAGMRYATRSLANSHARVPTEMLVKETGEAPTTGLVDPLVERKKEEVRAHARAEEDGRRQRDSYEQAQRRASYSPGLAEQMSQANRDAEERTQAALSRLLNDHHLDDQIARGSELLIVLAGDIDAPWLVRKVIAAAGSTPEAMASATLSGVTALSVSVASGHLESTRVLLDALRDGDAPPPRDLATIINMPDPHGRTPLRVAKDKGLNALAALLEERGAQPLPAAPTSPDVAFTVDERVLRYVREVEEAQQAAESIHFATATQGAEPEAKP